MPFNLGDVSIEGTANLEVDNANFDFENLLQINSTFNPYTFGASLIIDIWSSNKNREQYQEQINLLREISRKLDELNKTAKQILKAINSLPEKFGKVLDIELLKTDLRSNWLLIDNTLMIFESVEDFMITKDEWNDITLAYNSVCTYEYRINHLSAIPKVTELLNFISQGIYSDYTKILIQRVIDRIKLYQKEIGESLVEITKEFITETIIKQKKRYLSFYKIESNLNEVSDLRLIETKIIKATVPGMHSPSEDNEVPQIRKMIEKSKNKFVENFNFLTDSFNNYEALKSILRDISKVDYKSELANSKNYIKSE
ncbi:hypothetical protein [Winogradskyella flava]|uniref:Uncharacterized protein n=1 Tax=Winogradskyella flava TaxID=1884876 RepID=A0A842IWP5_9FLAO|nr:hypothetical protein [Winogradskyella flava]MBC2845208.1 hypothetical protein [Winogradskyella flava]